MGVRFDRLIFALAAVPLASSVVAQTPSLTLPPAPANVPREPRSNEAVGVSIDRFIGDAAKTPPRVSHEVMLIRPLLRNGDPYNPGKQGEVLQYVRQIAIADLGAGIATPMTTLTDQMILYVQSGEGRIDDGERSWNLRAGVAVMVPPGKAHRITAAPDAKLTMVMHTQTLDPSVKPRADILVRDTRQLIYVEKGGHWNNMAKYVFSGTDGMYETDRILLVEMGPMTMGGPHAHTPGQEEVWIKTTDGQALMQLGSEIRRWPKSAGFAVPPTGETVHAAYNLSDHVQTWFYFCRLAMKLPESGPRKPNPVEAEALKRATIEGTLLAGRR